MLPKIPKQGVWYAGLFGMLIQIGTMSFLALTKMWTLGGIITTLNILIYSWLGCAFLIGRGVEKRRTQERITVLKTVVIFALLIIGLTLTIQLVLTDGNDDIRQMKAAIAIGVGIVAMGPGIVLTVPRNREERHQIARPLRKAIAIALMVGGFFALSACYNWYKAAANCECAECSAPCTCSYPDCTNRTEP